MITLRNVKQPGSERLISASPWILATACLLLVILLIFFGVNNFRREQALFQNALMQRSLTLTRFISSAARESIRGYMRYSGEVGRWEDFMQAAISQAAEQPGVDAVTLVDGKGKIIARAGDERIDSLKNPAYKEILRDVHEQRSRVRNGFDGLRIISNRDGKVVIATPYLPSRLGWMGGNSNGRSMMSRMHQRGDTMWGKGFGSELKRVIGLEPVYIVQLDSSRLSSPLKSQLLQIVILLATTVLVGLGGALSLNTLRALRGSEMQLGSMQAFTDSVVSALPVGLVATDSSGKVKVCNAAAGAILDLKPENTIQQPVEQILPKQLSSFLDSSYEEHTPDIEISVILPDRKDPKILQISQLRIVENNDENGNGGGVLLIRDMTGVRKLEKDLQRSEKLAALGKVAAGVAHELRNPLSSIKGLATILRPAFEGESREGETVAMLIGEVERLNRAIGELLDYARPAALHLQGGRLTPLLDKTISLLEIDATSNNVEILFRCDEEASDIDIDTDKLSQVFLNLLLNGIQAMEQGGQITVRLEDRGGDRVVLFRDNGCGISEENLLKIFDPYFTTKNDGTGLGLAMSAKIIEEHGGSIRVSSVVGKGTDVWVTFEKNRTSAS